MDKTARIIFRWTELISNSLQYTYRTNIWFRFRGVIHKCKNLRGVADTAKFYMSANSFIFYSMT